MYDCELDYITKKTSTLPFNFCRTACCYAATAIFTCLPMLSILYFLPHDPK